MSCHSTPGNSAVTSLVCALARTPSDEVSRRFHALKHESEGLSEVPTREEVLEWLERQVLAVRNDEDLSAWRQARLLERLQAAIDSVDESMPDAATWHAWQNLRAACDDAHVHQWLTEVSGLKVPLAEAEPEDIDTQLADHWEKVYSLQQRRNVLLRDLRHDQANIGRYGITQDRVDRTRAKLVENQAAIDAEVDKTEPLEAEYLRRGRWARYYRVVTNGEGHVHGSRSCHTCYPTTRYAWLPGLSGNGELEAVDAYGREMCSICFPTVLAHPSYRTAGRIAEEVKARRAAEKAARDAVRAEKGITTRTGQPLILGAGRRWKEEIKSAVTAERTLVDRLARVRGDLSEASITSRPTFGRDTADTERHLEHLRNLRREAEEDIAVLLDALSGKRGVAANDLLSQMEVKADKKIARSQRG